MSLSIEKKERMPAYNGRFYEMAAVTPLTILYKFEHYYPAASVVETATTPSRHHVRRQRRERGGQ